MRSEMPDIEIMAPVGSYESLMAAVQAEADAVYFGIGRLNMRSRSANNFSVTDLPRITNICRENGIRSYLTVNTVVYDEEIHEMHTIVDAAKANGVSAIIATDISVIGYARSKGMEIHMSTQTNITNIDAVRFWSAYADVMVTARELNLGQVKELTKQIREKNICGPSGKPVQIEIFVHGALCMAISGKCYLSLDNFNSSANRGACLQPCRRPYRVSDRDSEVELEVDNDYIMSPKDLCTIGILDRILDAGVSVLKIEGRGRSADYVKTVVGVYREAANAVLDNDYSAERIRHWEERLRRVYNRDFWTGYYLGQKMGEWAEEYGSQASMRKVFLGKVTNYFKKIGVAEIGIETQSLQIGDEVMIIGPTTGVYETKVESLHKDEGPVEKAGKGDICAIKADQLVRRGDKVYKLVESGKLQQTVGRPKEMPGIYNLHTHSHYCDGKGSIDDHATQALAQGFHSLGFSSHAPVPFENKFAIREEDMDKYCREVRSAAKRYKEKLDIFLGLEIDYIPGLTKDFSYWKNAYSLDYTIGAIHLVKPENGDGLWFTDGSKQAVYDEGLKKYFGGDIRKAVRAYFIQIIEMLDTQKPDILGHFDKIRMHNKGRFFREDEPWYQDWIREVLDAAVRNQSIIEINTRGLYKKRSDDFFPSTKLFPLILERKIPVLISTDAHAPAEQALFYRQAMEELEKAGLREMAIFSRDGWGTVALDRIRMLK